MSPRRPAPGDERLLAFAVGGVLYALPISAVVEVAEVEEGLAPVPTLPRAIGGAINFHGDALPVLRGDALLGGSAAEPRLPEQIVVLSDGPSEKARLGLPVDEIVGLVPGPSALARGSDPIAERRAIDGRVANILDPARLVARAAAVVEETPVEAGTG